MLYEPVGYIYEYELGALAVLFIIMLRFFQARRFPNQKNKLYALILWVTVANILLDVFSSLIIDNVFIVPVVLIYLVNILFYASTELMLVLMMIYAYALVGYIDTARLRRMIPLLLPCILIFLLLFTNPITHWFFYYDPVQGYVHAILFGLTYITCLVYMIFTLIVVFRNRTVLRKEEFSTILLFMAVVLLATAVQFFVPALLISGVAIILSVVLMFFTIQNPESMVDMTTGAFTYEAMLTFLRDRMQEHDHVQLVAIKIFNMSRINDLLGIENGSTLLRQLFRFLNAETNDTWLFRMRGSCFVAVTRQKEDYCAIRTRLEQRVGEPWIVNGSEVLLKAALCCVETKELLEDSISPEEAVNYLETALDQKEHSGERIVNINVGSELFDKIKRNGAVEAGLRDALANGKGLELLFQPMWSVKQERFTNVEILLRFNHPTLGLIPPDEFVEIAENNGFVTALDEFVVRKTCEFLQAHNYLSNLGIETIEINLSALEFMHRRLPELLHEIMTQYEVSPDLLCFEVTETAATESFQLLQNCMSDIMKFGCHFALDDFGTGYANISQVIQLPFSTVKLDKSMLYGPPAVLEDLIRMFARIERQTVIEGVETAEQAELMQAFGVDIIQGYHYARPMNGDALLSLLQNS